ncbi:GNAT family N-acetyltransferase [Aliterella atlantica]|uniref:GCN5 family acetyltransferase n=2 Tax=Aliterella TaxID=1827277 RepID=A0A0D8ZTV7_9CYAN|nr:GCN5 family acetyltransferase [Aliterella atlantica CENA595]
MNNLPVLETQRLLLRSLNLNDAVDIFEYAADPQVSQYATWSAHQSINQSKQFIESVIAQYRNHQLAAWGIVCKADNKVIGTCGFTNWIATARRAEIGYALSSKYWGQGYMPEAVRLLFGFGFCLMKLNRIEAKCVIANTASARVMEKVGMQFEGILRQDLLAKGSFYDVKIYSILKQDWQTNCK